MRILKVILPFLVIFSTSCSKVTYDVEPYTSIHLSASTGVELSVRSRIIEAESALNKVVFAAYTTDNGKCIWCGEGNDAGFTCRMGTSLKIVALCNYHGLITEPKLDDNINILDNKIIEWNDLNLSIMSSNDIPMYGEVIYTPYGEQADVVVNVKRICNKVLISGEVSACGDVSAEGVDFDGDDRLTALIINSSSSIHIDGRPNEDCAGLPDIIVSQDLKNELDENGYAGTYYPTGIDSKLVLQFEHAGKIWHYPVEIGCITPNNEYRLNDVQIGRFIDWDEQWCREKLGIEISEWSGNQTINETI